MVIPHSLGRCAGAVNRKLNGYPVLYNCQEGNNLYPEAKGHP